MAACSASKSAAWSRTNALRIELAAQKTQVLALHMGFVASDRRVRPYTFFNDLHLLRHCYTP